MARQIISIYDLVSESLGPQASHNPSNNDGVANGVRALLLNLLATHGIEPINANPGDKLDARHMRPMLTCDTHDSCLDGTVHELVRPGFRRGVRVLRVAQVIIYRLNNKIERTDEPEHTQEQEQ